MKNQKNQIGRNLFFILCFSFGILNAQNAEYPLSNEGNFERYTTKTGQKISNGDQIQIGLPYFSNSFIFITQGNQNTGAFLSGDTVTIDKLESLGNTNTGYKMHAYIKGYGKIPVIINLESAIKSGEIIIIKDQ